jgi:hypothetical protein
MNPILLVKDAGFGETPVPSNALLQPGATLVINDANDGSKSDAVVLAVVPKGGCIEYAIADQNNQPRPLVVSDNESGETMYVVEHSGHRLYIPQKHMRRGIEAAKEAGLE